MRTVAERGHHIATMAQIIFTHAVLLVGLLLVGFTRSDHGSRRGPRSHSFDELPPGIQVWLAQADYGSELSACCAPEILMDRIGTSPVVSLLDDDMDIATNIATMEAWVAFRRFLRTTPVGEGWEWSFDDPILNLRHKWAHVSSSDLDMMRRQFRTRRD